MIRYFFAWLCFTVPLRSHGQEHRAGVWGGYNGSVRLTDKFSLWQDLHYVPQVFGVVRSGITFHAGTKVQMTAGHAWVWTATSFTTDLIRRESRPWAQILAQARLGEHLAGSIRFRYDARFRQQLADDRVLDDRAFHQRLRLMVRLRKDLKTYASGDILHLNLMDELLYNAGGQIPNGMDQNRVFLMPGITHGPYTLMAGYHVRMVPQEAGMRYDHGLTIWFLHTIDVRGRLRRSIPEVDPPLPHAR